MLRSDPQFAAKVEQAKSDLAKEIPNLLSGLVDLARSPENIKRSIEKKTLLVQEKQLDQTLDQLGEKDAKGDTKQIAERLIALRKEEEKVLQGVTDTKIIAQIRAIYDAKARAIQKGEM